MGRRGSVNPIAPKPGKNGHAEPESRAQPHVIHPHAVYTVAAARQALGLRPSTVATELRQGRLRVARRGHKHYILGAWLLEWLAAGELKRPGPA